MCVALPGIAEEIQGNMVKVDFHGSKVMAHGGLTAVRPGQLLIKITHDELTLLMGGETADLNLKGQPAIILMAGLQGSGKTTHAAKLAHYLHQKKGKKVMLAACDVYRPAAIEQLRVLGEQVGAKVYDAEQEKDPVKKAKDAVKEARTYGYDVLIVDTAGRLAIDEQMMQEIAAIKAAIEPSETLFVVDAMTGQDAVNTAKEFNDRIDFDGVILTKLDGDARGGAALSIRSVVDKPIKFIHPNRMADRILGMGDVVSLVERAQEQYDEQEARRIAKKIAQNRFDFNDFLGQLQQIRKMGSVKDLMGMIPGMDKALKNVEISDDAFKPVEAIISSMTPYERSHPECLNGSRKDRIARGSGTTIVEVNRFLKQFEQTGKMMRKVQQMRRR